MSQEGYGISYVVGESRLWFHVSAYTSCTKTSVPQMKEALKKALLDMYQICFADPSLGRAVTKKVFSIMRTD